MSRTTFSTRGTAHPCRQLDVTPFTAEMSRDERGIAAAGLAEGEKARTHLRNGPADQKAPPMAVKGSANLTATNVTVGTRAVHITRARSRGRHAWEFEASPGHAHLVCMTCDTRAVLSARGGRLSDRNGKNPQAPTLRLRRGNVDPQETS